MANLVKSSGLIRWLTTSAACWALAATMGCQARDNTASPVRAAWGERGAILGQFVKPRAIAVDANNRLYIVDMLASIQVFEGDGAALRRWRTPTHAFGRPSGLAINARGQLLVADSHYHRILFYDENGSLLDTWGGDDAPPPLGGRFGYIGDIVEGRDGAVYVAESHQNERITKLSPTGEVLAEWGGRGEEPGRFQRVRALAIGPEGWLYAADACNHRVQVFDADGELKKVIGAQGEGLGQLSYPYDLAFAPDGTFVVCEYGNHRIQRFNKAGESLGAWGKPGRDVGQLWNPWAVAVDHDGRVFVVDSNNHRVQEADF